MRYYYIVLDDKTAMCFTKMKIAKCQAKEHKSLVYFSKKQLPDFVKEVKGACIDSKKGISGKFTSSLDANKFNRI